MSSGWTRLMMRLFHSSDDGGEECSLSDFVVLGFELRVGFRIRFVSFLKVVSLSSREF